MLTSHYNHCILYAGGSHCHDIAELLSKPPFNFVIVLDIGSEAEYTQDIVTDAFLLTPTVWNFLQEDPQVSYDRFLKNGVLIKKVSIDFNNSIKKLFDQKDITEEQLLEELQKHNLAGTNHYINFAAVHERIPLFDKAISKNFSRVLEYLIDLGGFITSSTNIFYNPISDGKTDIIRILLKKGTLEYQKAKETDPQYSGVTMEQVYEEALEKKLPPDIIEKLKPHDTKAANLADHANSFLSTLTDAWHYVVENVTSFFKQMFD